MNNNNISQGIPFASPAPSLSPLPHAHSCTTSQQQAIQQQQAQQPHPHWQHLQHPPHSQHSQPQHPFGTQMMVQPQLHPVPTQYRHYPQGQLYCPSQPSQRPSFSPPSQYNPMQRSSSSGPLRAVAPNPIPSPSPSVFRSPSPIVIRSNEKRPRSEMDPEPATDLSSILDRETMLLFPELSDTLSNGNSNKRRKNGSGSGSGSGGGSGSGSGSGRGSGRGGNRRVIASNTNTNSNTSISTSSNDNNNNGDDNDNNDNNYNNVGTHTIDHPTVISDDDDEAEQEEEEEEGSLDVGADDNGLPRIATGFWAKPDVQQFMVWLFDIENARRYIKPGTTAGTKLADVQREVASIVNAAMAELPPPSPPAKPRVKWTARTVKEKFRYIKDQYDKCVKLMKATGNGDTESSTLAEAINDITPYYNELVAIFGAQLTRNHPPLRDSATPGRATFVLNEPDLEERAPASVSLSSSRSRLNPQNEHPLYASLKSIVSEFTTQSSASTTVTGESQETKEMKFHMEFIERERAACERERRALEKDKEDWRERTQRESARMEREREDLRSDTNRQRDLIDDLREELKQAKAAFLTERLRHQEDVLAFRDKNKDREALVRTEIKYKMLVEGRTGSMSPKNENK
ncbi:MAG: hypothetical protein J3R72DRAFT_449912 [Linnemannia gamsii]|nr:MAG: hypothetical protein J3R72DRAFT_449912 [Linnemannia gamsii]